MRDNRPLSLSVLIARNNSLENYLQLHPPSPAARLQILDLSHNLISATGLNITTLFEMGCPRYLNLSDNKFTGLVDFHSNDNPNNPPSCSVTQLSLAKNSITSIGELYRQPYLEYLDIRDNMIQSHFLNPKESPGFTALKKCLLGSETNYFCVDDFNQVPAVCGTIEKW